MMIHSFLMIGQSNMAGRGFREDVEPIENDRLNVLRNGRWQKLYIPVNCDRSFSGVSLAESFADEYAKAKNVDVGLIPCADGGTSLSQWRPGGLLYDHAVCQAGLAQRTSTIAGVLWHQGEGDCADELFPLYEEKLVEIINSFRRDLDLYDVPFLLGGLGDFLKDCKMDPELKNYVFVNEALRNIALKDPMTGFVPAGGLKANPDNLHFCAKSLREFGIRYFQEFIKIEDRGKIYMEKACDDAVRRTYMERL